MKINSYDLITNLIIEKLDQGVVPWQRPWRASTDRPMNVSTMNSYSGINIMILLSRGYNSRYWGTFNQIRKMGGRVKKGERSTPIVIYRKYDKEERNKETGEKESKPLFVLKHWNVFNMEQCENMDDYIKKDDKELKWNTEDLSDNELMAQMACKPSLLNQGGKAYYSPSNDHINMPSRNVFNSKESYYSTFFHELSHSTGHDSRLGRESFKKICKYGDKTYSKEELIAEFSSSFLCAEFGFNTENVFCNNVAYINSWKKVLKADKKMLISAASNGHKAANYILGDGGQLVQ